MRRRRRLDRERARRRIPSTFIRHLGDGRAPAPANVEAKQREPPAAGLRLLVERVKLAASRGAKRHLETDAAGEQRLRGPHAGGHVRRGGGAHLGDEVADVDVPMGSRLVLG